MSVRWCVIGEAAADQRIAADLADRVILANVQWAEAEVLEHLRTWVGSGNLPEGVRSLTWQNLRLFAEHFGIKPRGFFGDRPGEQDARQARIAVAVAKRICGDDGAVVLVRDADKNVAQREQGLRQVLTTTTDIPIVIGLANPEREVWVLSGFDPADDDEEKALANERKRLGFDPRTQSHRLTATSDNQATKSPKRVLLALSGGSWDRESVCWLETGLETLGEQGASNGLSRFLQEIRTILVPLIAGRAARP